MVFLGVAAYINTRWREADRLKLEHLAKSDILAGLVNIEIS